MFLRNRDLEHTQEEYNQILFNLGILDDDEDYHLYIKQESRYDFSVQCSRKYLTQTKERFKMANKLDKASVTEILEELAKRCVEQDISDFTDNDIKVEYGNRFGEPCIEDYTDDEILGEIYSRNLEDAIVENDDQMKSIETLGNKILIGFNNGALLLEDVRSLIQLITGKIVCK